MFPEEADGTRSEGQQATPQPPLSTSHVPSLRLPRTRANVAGRGTSYDHVTGRDLIVSDVSVREPRISQDRVVGVLKVLFRYGRGRRDTSLSRVPDEVVDRCEEAASGLVAGVLEVLRALAAAHHLSWEDIVSEAGRKRAERGGFDSRIFLEYVEQTR
jgi:hypothetical protein